MADRPVPIDLDEVQETARELVGDAGAQVAEAGELTAERLEEARALLVERAGEAREVLVDRAKTHGPELAAWARSTGADLAERAAPVISERAAQARDEAARRWHDLEEELPVDVDVEKVGRQIERGVWQVISSLLSVLLLVPKLLVRGLGALGRFADDLGDRGVVAGERAREAVAAVPPSRRDRRRRTLRTAAWTGAGFGAGILVGWVLGRRDDTTVSYEPAGIGDHLSSSAMDPYPVPPGPVASTAPARDTTDATDDPAVDAHPVPPGPVADLPDAGASDDAPTADDDPAGADDQEEPAVDDDQAAAEHDDARAQEDDEDRG